MLPDLWILWEVKTGIPLNTEAPKQIGLPMCLGQLAAPRTPPLGWALRPRDGQLDHGQHSLRESHCFANNGLGPYELGPKGRGGTPPQGPVKRYVLPSTARIVF